MERSWEYVQERIDLILQDMNQNPQKMKEEKTSEIMTFMVAPSSGRNPWDQRVTTRMSVPSSGMITTNMRSASSQRPLDSITLMGGTSSQRNSQMFGNQRIYQLEEEDEGCGSGACQIRPSAVVPSTVLQPKPIQEQIRWIDGNNQVSWPGLG